MSCRSLGGKRTVVAWVSRRGERLPTESARKGRHGLPALVRWRVDTLLTKTAAAVQERNKKSPREFPRAHTGVRPSAQDAGDHFALHQFARLVEVVVHDGPGVNPDAVVNRGEKVLRIDRVLQRRRRGLVRLAVDEAALDAGPRDAGGVAI